MKIIATKLLDAKEGAGIINFSRKYTSSEGLSCKQFKKTQRESDYVNGNEYRISLDNGKTYGAWIPVENPTTAEMFGEDEMISDETERIWNPVHKHFVSVYWTRYFLEGHEKAYVAYWQRGECRFFDHQYITVSDNIDGDFLSRELMKYEGGVDFDSRNPRNPEFLEKNRGYINTPTVLKCGDIIVPISPSVRVGCEIAGIDVNRVFPSCPDIHRCVMIARGKYDEKCGRYKFTYSNPVILGDLRSSRGIDEPIVTELSSSRLLLVMRGSNVKSEKWKTRVEDGTPSFKWFSYSDDGGKTFTEPEPWRFDDREVIYSSATISQFIRSSKNGKLYWIGNITDNTAYGNFPRFPLYIAEVDEALGLLKKDSLQLIDTRRAGESNEVQLSNFSLIEDRESLNFELCLSKLGQFDKKRPFYGESWKYEIII